MPAGGLRAGKVYIIGPYLPVAWIKRPQHCAEKWQFDFPSIKTDVKKKLFRHGVRQARLELASPVLIRPSTAAPFGHALPTLLAANSFSWVQPTSAIFEQQNQSSPVPLPEENHPSIRASWGQSSIRYFEGA
jgi:hypothetical protein